MCDVLCQIQRYVTVKYSSMSPSPGTSALQKTLFTETPGYLPQSQTDNRLATFG